MFRYQLGFALLLAELLPGLAAPLDAFDPAFDDVDRALLSNLGVTVGGSCYMAGALSLPRSTPVALQLCCTMQHSGPGSSPVLMVGCVQLPVRVQQLKGMWMLRGDIAHFRRQKPSKKLWHWQHL